VIVVPSSPTTVIVAPAEAAAVAVAAVAVAGASVLAVGAAELGDADGAADSEATGVDDRPGIGAVAPGPEHAVSNVARTKLASGRTNENPFRRSLEGAGLVVGRMGAFPFSRRNLARPWVRRPDFRRSTRRSP
jgi:hypothetical protein